MKKYLYFNYFRDNNPARRKEYLYCVKQNLGKSFIDGYFIFLDDKEHAADIPKDSRITFISLNRRMDFQDAIDHANANLDPDSVVIIVNLDIYLGNDAWANIDQDFFAVGHPHKAMVCARHNLQSDPEKPNVQVMVEGSNWLAGNFSDAYVLKTPLLPGFLQEDFRFCLGHAPQCDNLMMGLLNKHYHTYSWGRKYMIMHYDICRHANFDQKVDTYKDTVDLRAKPRIEEQRNIPTQQPWNDLLATGQPPIATYTWFDYQKT